MSHTHRLVLLIVYMIVTGTFAALAVMPDTDNQRVTYSASISLRLFFLAIAISVGAAAYDLINSE